MSEFYKLTLPSPTSDELVELKFDFSVESMPDYDTEDADFPYPDEVFSVNFGETGKFTSNYVYQSRFLVLRNGEGLNFNGYAPDFARKSNIMRDCNGNTLFHTKTTYSVKLTVTKYRVYIDVNNGFATTSYGNGRDEVTDVAFYVRMGTVVKLENCSISHGALPDWKMDENVAFFIEKGLVCNYLSYHVGPDGVYFDRLSIPQNIKCTTRNSGAYQSGVCLDAYTDAKWLKLTYTVTDTPCEGWPTQFGLLVNGRRVEMPITVTDKDNTYTEYFPLSGECCRMTVFFPFSVSAAVKKIELSPCARLAPVQKNGRINFYGDSITEGSECFDAAAVYMAQVCSKYNFSGLNQAVSGRTFNDYNVLGEYPVTPDYVIIANGTNSFASGVGDKQRIFEDMERDMVLVIESAMERFPDAKIIALLPIWRSDCEGERFSLFDTVEKIKSVYARYPEISVIDCFSFVPESYEYFSSTELAIHPNSKGHDEYGRKLLKALVPIMGEPEERDEPALAKLALNAK